MTRDYCKRRGQIYFVCLTLAVLGSPSAAVAVSPSEGPVTTRSAVLDEAEHVATSNEGWEEKGASVFLEPQSRAAELQKESSALTEYLKDNPQDVRALLLKARILRALIVAIPTGFQTDQKGTRVISGDTSNTRADAIAAIDRALALDPANAEAFYWKARILSLHTPTIEEVQSGRQDLDTAPVVEALRKAVSLAPANTTYREYLALALLASGQRAEALQEFHSLPGKHPALQLLEDVELIPLPPGAKLDQQGWSELWAEGFEGHMDVFKYPGLRTFVYSVPSPLTDVEAFYTAKWPTIRFKSEQAQNVEHAIAGLIWRETRLQPVPDPAVFDTDWDKQLPPSGIILELGEVKSKQTSSTTIVLMNLRRF